jgi:hypothetical protein
MLNDNHIDSEDLKSELMIVKFEGKDRSYKINQLKMQEESIKNIDMFLNIPIVINGDLIYLYHINNFQIKSIKESEPNNCSEYMYNKQYDKRSYEDNVNFTYIEFFEKCISDFLNDIEIKNKKLNITDKTIILNILLIEKPISNLDKEKIIKISKEKNKNKNENENNNMHNLGFIPEKLFNKYKNIKIFSSNLADICLMNIIYNKILNKENMINIMIMHFDSRKNNFQISIYTEGLINNKISGLNYDSNKNLIQNMENIFIFIKKIINIFELISFNFSFMHLDEK